MKKNYLIIFFLQLIPVLLAAQNESNTWYFGYNAGLDFNSGAPVPLTNGSIHTLEGCATISDKNTGAVLFYTDGITVWNRIDSVMPNGMGLFGNPSSSQSAVIVPDPGNLNQYYIFTAGAQAGLSGNYSGIAYSKVDMTLDGGLGEVTVKNDSLIYPATEKLCVTHHCNGTDYWVITHQWNTDSFYVYQVTANGILPQVISEAGTVHQNIGSTNNSEAIGCMKVSPDGSKIALACYVPLNVFEMLAFDYSSGMVSNAVTDTYPLAGSYGGPYSVSFSPNSSKVYVSYHDLAGNPNYIFQYNVNAGSPAAFLGSKTIVASTAALSFGSMQLGPDNKLYISTLFHNNISGVTGSPTIDAFNSPDLAGIACGYVANADSVGGLSTWGLPNFNDCNIYHTAIDLGADTTISSSTSFTFDAGMPGTTYTWSTGESTQTISVFVSSDTTIWVTVINPNGCQQSDTIHIYLVPPLSGNSLQFDGTDDQTDCSLPPVFNNISANDFTIEAWVYPQGNAFNRIVFAELSTTEFASLGTSDSNEIFFYVVTGGATYSVETLDDIPLNQWTHVAARWKAASQAVDIFIDGVLQATNGGGGSSSGTVNMMTIGAKPGGTQNFNGALDELRIWNIARSDCDIAANKNTTLTGTGPNLEVLYTFNQGIGGGNNAGLDTLVDLAGNNTGSLNNFALTGLISNWITSGAGITVTGLQPGLDASVTQAGPLLTANEPGATYQWLDCDNGFAPIAGQTGQSFTATQDGNYAVAVTNSVCTDTSACYNVIISGIMNNSPADHITLSPNPAHGEVNVLLNREYENVIVEMNDVMGKNVWSYSYHTIQNIHISLTQPPGVYFICITVDGNRIVSKLVKAQ